MNEEDYKFNVEQMYAALRVQAANYPKQDGYAYTSAADFLVQHGVDYRPGAAWRHYPRGKQKECFGNAISLAASRRIPYVEGVALSPSGEIFSHAWNLTPLGRLVDSTWCNCGLAYIGVVFSVERADDATWNGDAHILGDEHRGYPIFRERWQGEDYSIQWPFSDRMEAYKRFHLTGVFETAPSIEKWLEEKRRA